MVTHLEKFFSSGRKKTFSAGETILNGQEASGAFYIYKGFVKVYSINDEGEEYLHVIYKPGELFPLIWVLKDVKRRVFYEALSDVELLEVPKQVFLRAVSQDVDLAYEVMKRQAEQFYTYADRLDNLQYKKAYERVVYRLLFLAGRFGVKDGRAVIIKAPITHELIGQSINLTRETVSRDIERLEKAGLVSRSGHHIVINDVQKLADEFSEPDSLDLWGLG